MLCLDRKGFWKVINIAHTTSFIDHRTFFSLIRLWYVVHVFLFLFQMAFKRPFFSLMHFILNISYLFTLWLHIHVLPDSIGFLTSTNSLPLWTILSYLLNAANLIYNDHHKRYYLLFGQHVSYHMQITIDNLCDNVSLLICFPLCKI